MSDLISRADAMAYIDRIINSGLGRNKSLDYIRKYISLLPSAEAVQSYTEWLEKIILDTESFEWLCEDTNDKEWCEKNCHYASIQAECLRHLYEVSKGGDTE